MDKRQWEQISWDTDYAVSNDGLVMSFKKYTYGMLIKPWICSGTGYPQIDLSKRKRASVHRLVAEAFCHKPEGKDHVNHKNGVRDDNRATNLEWVTPSENQIHSFVVLGRISHTTGKFGKDHSSSKAIISTDMKTGEEKHYECALEAVKNEGFDSGCISRCCHGESAHHKGRYWKFA